MPFQVIVVGAGIAGLAAAIALRGEGREVTVLESSRLKSEIGAAIHLAPNATKILYKWGIDIQKEARALAVREIQEIGANGAVHMKIPMNTEKIFGAPWLLQHRVDLHNALRRAAESTSGAGAPAKIVTGAKVASLDGESGTVKTEDGRTFQGDLIVGADGIHSIVRAAVLEEKNIARPSGHSAYRCLLPKDELTDVPEVMQVFEQDKNKMLIVVGGDRRVILYPCRDGTILNIVAVCPDTSMKEESTQSWNAVGTTEDLLQVYENFPEWLRKTLSLAKEPGLWQLRDQDPLPTWVKGRAIIIGDAAHAMLPHQGQGAGQSIEDAEALGALFANVKSSQSTGEVNTVLEKVFKARIKRASLIQAYSRQQAMPAGKDDNLFLNAQQFSGYNWAYEGILAWIEKEASEEKKVI